MVKSASKWTEQDVLSLTTNGFEGSSNLEYKRSLHGSCHVPVPLGGLVMGKCRCHSDRSVQGY